VGACGIDRHAALSLRLGDPAREATATKIEINTRQHFTVYGHQTQHLAVESRWFAASADVRTFHLDELLGTKLRALYQRRYGRDLAPAGEVT
jgi:hypothetical protein